jgi:hypothetical protein
VTKRDRAYAAVGRNVLVEGESVGAVTGILLDRSQARVIGLEVTLRSVERRFLPTVAATLRDGIVEVGSTLHLVDPYEEYVRSGAVVWRGRRVSAELSPGTSRP